MQLALGGLEAHHYRPHSSNGLGFWGEDWVSETLTKKGYQVTPHPTRGCHFDLLVKQPTTGQLWRVEVKTARKASDGKWRFLLWRKGHQTHHDSHLVILLAVTPIWTVYPFVVPTSQLLNQNQAVITSHPQDYKGKLAPFRQHGFTLNLEVL